ncbi:MAG: undecaprenyldiphospho-muramoylpentapeptide beta-N-acetylglucosaminyltransferase [Bacteroidetes bacterium]|nr:MAG: undecaprenyldiphospho-muramoylpentapeptide beta-N-acetylglucosaminyltransferase [Bacteroidota bacterium]
MSRFIISGGGTGGHVYPAIAIAQAIRRREPGAEILFVGAKGRLEMEKVPAAGFRISGLPVAGFIRRASWKNITFSFKLLQSLRLARSLIRKFNPDVVIGVGGYASGPTLRVAVSLGIPALIQEQNSFPGVTNRLLGNKVSAICVAYDGMDRYFPGEKIILTGNPVRSDLLALSGHPAEAYVHFGLDPARKTILVLGGSGGAKTINESILALLEQGLPDDVQLLWQTGKTYYERCKVQGARFKYRDSFKEDQKPCFLSLEPCILPFIDRMDLAYAVADLVISRAGAIAISELCVAGKPVILIPSPNVAEDHQTKNARALADQGAAALVPDKEAKAILPGMVIKLIREEDTRQKLGQQIRNLAIPDAADRIADEVFKLAGTKTHRNG